MGIGCQFSRRLPGVSHVPDTQALRGGWYKVREPRATVDSFRTICQSSHLRILVPRDIKLRKKSSMIK